MHNDNYEFNIGHYRPIYLWGGSGTIRMNRLKFMNQPVDEKAHHQAHTEEGAKRVLQDMNCNWVHLMYDWGFPPEIESGDWEEFQQAAQVYHKMGSKVFAYIQTSNCVYDGSFKEKDWYAQDHRGGKIYYYSGRYMVDLTHPAWIAHLKETIQGAIQRGADGIFFDNLWHGEMPVSLFNTWLGAAGCHCERCQQKYFQASGKKIPSKIDTKDENVIKYLDWRANQLTELIELLSAYIQEIQPGTVISSNDYDIIMRPTFLVFGQDTTKLSRIPNKKITMIENFALPSWEEKSKQRLANNALTIRNTRAIMNPEAHLSVLSYDVGIGFDPTYPPRRYQQGIAESAACGASTTIKGTEYFYEGSHTILTPEKFAPIQKAIGKYNRWLKANRELYLNRQNIAPVALLFPGKQLWLDWHQLAPLYHGVGQTLIHAGIPWRVVNPDDDFKELKVLLVFQKEQLNEILLPKQLQVIQVTELPGWKPSGKSLLERIPLLYSLSESAAHSLVNNYMGNKTARRMMDALGMAKMITQTSLFNLPPIKNRQSLLQTLPTDLFPRVVSPQPTLIEVWQRDDELQIHLMNYAKQPQKVQLLLDHEVSANTVSPDENDGQYFEAKKFDLTLDIYKILRINHH